MTRLMTVLTVFVSVFMACLFLMFFATAAKAQDQCFPRDKVIAFLAERHQEYVRSAGVAPNGYVVETFVSQSGSFTILATSARTNKACVIATGRGWEEYEAHELEGDPS